MNDAEIDTVVLKTARRRQLLTVLHPPGGAATSTQVDRAVNLALQYQWNVEPPAFGRVMSSQRTRTIFTTPIYGDSELALFAHEGGHVQDVAANARRHSQPLPGEIGLISVEAEVVAWRWAIQQLGYRWSPTMQTFMRSCLATYAHHVQREGERRAVLAVIAEGDDKARHVVRLRPSCPDDWSIR